MLFAMSDPIKVFLHLCLVINLISASISESVTSTIEPHQNKSSTKTQNITQEKGKTKAVLAEGGTIVDNIQPLTLPKQSDKINKDLIKESSSVTSGPKVVPRKGVGDFNKVNKDLIKESSSVTSGPKVVPRKGVGDFNPDDIKVNNDDHNNDNLHTQNSTSAPIVNLKNNTSQKFPNKIKTTTKKPVKKPLILSYEALAKIDKESANNLKAPVIKSSSDSLVTNQMPVPSKSKESPVPIKYEYISKKDTHPELIMPFVISILLIPMFAVVAYLVFRRGRDAWKNRHYKRMDFLLDGMYND